MARIRLATWHAGHAPGEVVEVPDDEVLGLRRDGRVAEVVADESPAAVSASSKPAADPVLSREQHEKLAETAKPKRRGKSDEG